MIRSEYPKVQYAEHKQTELSTQLLCTKERHRSERIVPFLCTVADVASRIALIEVFINLTRLIKAEDSLFVNKELMRASVACGWVLLREFLTVFHFLDTHICYVSDVLPLLLCNFF
jgi:uncharacterized membrane protein